MIWMRLTSQAKIGVKSTMSFLSASSKLFNNNAVVENFVLSKGKYGVMDVKVIDGDYACTKRQCEQEGVIFARGSPHHTSPEKIVGLENIKMHLGLHALVYTVSPALRPPRPPIFFECKLSLHLIS